MDQQTKTNIDSGCVGAVGQTESASPRLVRLSSLLGKCGEGDRVGLTLIPVAAGAGVRWGGVG